MKYDPTPAPVPGFLPRLRVLIRSKKYEWASSIVIVSIPSLIVTALFFGCFLLIALPAHRESLVEANKKMIRELSNAAWMLLSNYEHRFQSGELSLEEAQKRARERIRSLSYGSDGKNYFWIINQQSQVIMNPYRPDLEGVNAENSLSANLKDFVVRSIDTVERQGEGYIQYHWQKYDDQNLIAEKLAYVKGFNSWGWIIGTGIYLEEIEKEVEHFIGEFELAYTGIFLVVTLISIYIIWRRKAENYHRALAEETWEKSEFKYRTILETMLEGYVEFDLEGNIVFLNSAASEIIGYSADELYGMNNRQYMTPDMAKFVYGNFNQVYQTGIPKRFQFEVIRKDGKTVYLEGSVQLKESNSNTPAGFRVVAFDISKRKTAQQEQKRLQNLLNTIFDSMPSALLSIDTNLRITRWNKIAREMVSCSDCAETDEALTRVFPQFQAEAVRLIRGVFRERKPLKTKQTWKTEGQVRHMEIMIYPLLSEVNEGAVIRVDDVTDRIRMEEVMVQTEKMISLGGLIAGVAHEINNPLGGILSGSQNLQRRLHPDLAVNKKIARKHGIDLHQLQEYLKERNIISTVDGIREMAIRAAEIIKNMLHFSRKSDSNLATVNLPDIVNSTIDMAGNDWDLKKKSNFKSISIKRDFEDNLPQIPCNKTEITQVILNLLNNAAFAMMGTSDLRYPQIRIRLQKEKDYIRLEVKDNGPGIKPSLQKRIFEPFFTTKPVGDGTGLGLAVSYSIITNNHNGTIEVESRPGEGTKFIIRLPLEPKPGTTV